MTLTYKTAEGERLVRERCLAFLKYWTVPNEHVRIATSQGETFVVASGDVNAPPLLLLHGSAGNSVMWIGDIAAFAACFRVYAIDVIGEAGLSAPMLVSNCTFDRGSLSATYDTLFDRLVDGNHSGNWLGVRDDFRNWLIRAA